MNPVACPLSDILNYQQHFLDSGRVASTLRVHVASLSIHHCYINGRLVGEDCWVTQFLRIARRLSPLKQRHTATLDLPLVLRALSEPPFEPYQERPCKSCHLRMHSLWL